jgi:hypothetical protein
MTDRPLKRGPKGGVYYVARSGARVYVDRSSLPNRVSRPAVSAETDAPGNPNPSYWWLNAAGLGAFFLVILPLILRF